MHNPVARVTRHLHQMGEGTRTKTVTTTATKTDGIADAYKKIHHRIVNETVSKITEKKGKAGEAKETAEMTLALPPPLPLLLLTRGIGAWAHEETVKKRNVTATDLLAMMTNSH